MLVETFGTAILEHPMLDTARGISLAIVLDVAGVKMSDEDVRTLHDRLYVWSAPWRTAAAAATEPRRRDGSVAATAPRPTAAGRARDPGDRHRPPEQVQTLPMIQSSRSLRPPVVGRRRGVHRSGDLADHR